MHISEGVAPIGIALAGAAIAVPCIAVGLRALRDEQIPRAALTASVLFVSTLVIRLPIGPSSVHPLLGGLAGLFLGWAAMPVFLVSLFLQALLFQFGGITTLGINTVVMGLPAVLVYYLFNGRVRKAGAGKSAFFWGMMAGVTAYLVSFVLWATALILCGKQMGPIVGIALIPNIIVAVAEGIFTGFVAAFLLRVYPSVFELSAARSKGGKR
ncbi:MAG: cobalt transporter CbiM [Candidatus Krumholzibacteria bacterium]|nr:cobalt transporter CbiM [Candidatus Krumholzibacteria bacterium]